VENWLKAPFDADAYWFFPQIERRAIVLGAMGRTSVEGDVATRVLLAQSEPLRATVGPRDEETDHLERWFEAIARLGFGARLAIPRLEVYRRHTNPWVRMWAGDALAKIDRKAQPSAKSAR
jgi:hypothetical protein